MSFTQEILFFTWAFQGRSPSRKETNKEDFVSQKRKKLIGLKGHLPRVLPQHTKIEPQAGNLGQKDHLRIRSIFYLMYTQVSYIQFQVATSTGYLELQLTRLLLLYYYLVQQIIIIIIINLDNQIIPKVVDIIDFRCMANYYNLSIIEHLGLDICICVCACMCIHIYESVLEQTHPGSQKPIS